MPLTAGQKLGPYEIVAPIGKGGMGEVYRARDTKLDRDVAIKVLPEELATDEERVARFEREARLLASLNHPNIASIYGFESNALVLELVEGPTLAERIQQGPIPVEEAIAIATQIAEALEAGHEAGVIHRDLKPANIKLKEEGTIKVLDYGLAKALGGDVPASVESELSQSPTLAKGTQIGVILGTAAYMSPEQARGKPVDTRTDVWAFGAVLYEMVTGRRAFEAEDVSLTLAEVMKSEPDWSALPAGLSPTLRTYLMRCLEKDPKGRIRDIGDVRLALDGAFETSAAVSPLTNRRVAWPALGVAAALGAVLAGVVTWSFRGTATERPLVVFEVSMPSGASLDLSRPDTDVAISPDGTKVAYAIRDGNERTFVLRSTDALEPVPLSDLTISARGPFFSPDGQWIGFFDQSALVRVSVDGGPTLPICGARAGGARGASWGSDDSIVYASQGPSGLMRVATDGCDSEVLTTPDSEGDHLWPEFLPGAEAVLFTVSGRSIETSSIAVVSLATKEWKILLRGGTHPRYAPSGHIVYAVSGSLHAVGFDVDRLELTGNPVPVIDRAVTTAYGGAEFDVASGGALVYAEGAAQASARRTLVWKDRQGVVTPLAVEPRAYIEVRISPDGSAAALSIRDEERDIWIWDLEQETMRRLTFDDGNDIRPVWTTDGKHLVFSSERGGALELFRKASDGTGPVERITDRGSLLLAAGRLAGRR